MTSPVAKWHVPDIGAELAEIVATGAPAKTAAHDVDVRRPSASARYLVPLSFDSDGE